jgi:hypothetical protein
MTDNRIAALEHKIAEMQTELVALKGKTAPPTPPPKDEGPRIVLLNDERTTGMPNLAELKKLFSIVRPRVPENRDPDAAFQGFTTALRYVSNCGRLTAPNNKYSLGWWFDDLTQWLRKRDAMSDDIALSSLIGAILASGDINYVEHNGALGHVWEFAISPPNHGGKPASDSWKQVLQGNILAPSQPARQVRIVSGY